jgi:signal transduction histidine kinase/CheY-like chemotaxis protein
MHNKLLIRQLRRPLGLAVPDSATGVDEWLHAADAAATAELITRLPQFFAAVSESYDSYERDLALRGRSLELSSGELIEANERLRAEAEKQREVLESLNDTLTQLLPSTPSREARQANDLLALSSEVRQLVQEREATRAALVEAKRAAEEASTTKTQFLAKVSHELRTPMNAILGMSELVLEGQLSVEQKQLVRCVYDSANHLLGTVNEILDFASMEGERLVLAKTSFELCPLVQETTLFVASKAREKGLGLITNFAPGLPLTILGDPARLRQVLFNLLSNAIKFTIEGTVEMAVRPARNAPGSICFSVRDTGVGISPEKQHQIWQGFSQADNSNARAYGGLGLGLTISSHLVRLMGGKLTVDSRLGHGSTFNFTIPVEFATEPVAIVEESYAAPVLRPSLLRHSRSPSSRLARRRILLVEDNPTNQQLAKRILVRLGYDVDVADDGMIGVEYFSSNVYDLIFMDLQMPRLDGLSATRQIRGIEMQRGGHIPIIALTANVAAGDRDSCFAAGMDDYVSKPIRIDAIRAALSRAKSQSA